MSKRRDTGIILDRPESFHSFSGNQGKQLGIEC